MPKQSKIASTKSKQSSSANNGLVNQYICTRCGKTYKNQTVSFPSSQSPLFQENNKRLPVCKTCINEIFQYYKERFGDEKAAIKRICLKFDMYWSEDIYNLVPKSNTSTSRILSYISKLNSNSNLLQYAGKTFDDAIEEEERLFGARAVSRLASETNAVVDKEELEATQKSIDFWGMGFPAVYYAELDKHWADWCGDRDPKTMDKAEMSLYKQICLLEVKIAQDAAAGKSIDRDISALNTVLGSANVKPVQKQKDEAGNDIEQQPFGVWINKIENTRPISEPSDDFKDVDGIIKYITTWFFGHMCKMLNIKNRYSHLYEDAMARLRVERPEYENEDESAIYDDIFERAENKDDSDEANFFGDIEPLDASGGDNSD